jgi:putative glycerol-1-phosphate prenyltransferase
MSIYQNILQQKRNQQKSLAILLDPDKVDLKTVKDIAHNILKQKADYVFVGGSLLSKGTTKKLIKKLKKLLDIPVILFPGNPQQITKKADGILFLSLISGRNVAYLIENQVIAAPILAQSKIETLATGYMLIEGGQVSSTEYITNTKPIPRKKTDIALATALAGEMLGLKMIYLEAGSGAKKHVPLKMIKAVSEKLQIPIIVGGGIKNRKQMLKAFNAGADIVVVGTAFENNEWK